MKKAQRTDFFREIKKSLNRYLSILFIVALGVAFYAGIRSAQPDMDMSLDAYYEETEMMDIRVLGTLGMTKGDVEAISRIPGVTAAEGSYQTEVISKIKEDEKVVTVYAIGDLMNRPTLEEGRLPVAANECFADKSFVRENGLKLGDTITVASGNDNDIEDTLAETEYTIVGIGEYAWYLSLQRGAASIGDGSSDGFIMIPKDSFSMKAFTTVYARIDAGGAASYTDIYEDRVEEITKEIEAIADERCEIRFVSVQEEAQEKITDGEKKIADAETELADAEKKLADADAEILDGRQKFEDGEKEWLDGRKEFLQKEKEFNDAKAELADARKQLDDGWLELGKGEGEAGKGWDILREKEAEWQAGKDQLEAARKELDAGRTQLDDGWKQYNAIVSELDSLSATVAAIKETEAATGEKQMEERIALREQLIQLIDSLPPEMIDKLPAKILGQIVEQLPNDEIDEMFDEILNELPPEIIDRLPPEILDKPASEILNEILERLPEGSLNEILDRILDELPPEIVDKIPPEVIDKLPTDLKELIPPADSEAFLPVVEYCLDFAKNELKDVKGELDSGESEWWAGKAEFSKAEILILDGQAQIAEARKALEDGDRQLADARKELEEGEASYADGMAKFQDGEVQLEDGRRELKKGKKELDDARKELADGEQELADAKAEYADAKAEADVELADAKEKIADAKEQLADLKVPEWYVLDRGSIQSYVEYGMDADRMGAVGQVFPAIFFLVAALVSLTTMTRMVEDERTQIGTLKALGYGKWAIASKYILYALSATLIGSVIGIFVGGKLLPSIIMSAYGILYTGLPVRLNPIQPGLSVMSLVLAVLCTVLATVAACYKEFLSSPAQLMRPAAPKQGKRVLLERVTFLWKHLNFTGKATIRNLFRYKKRFLMTVFGIGGCMALLMVSFGLRDSIQEIVNNQYATIFTYNAYISIDEEAESGERKDLAAQLVEDGKANETLYINQTAYDVEANGITKNAYLFVPENVEKMSDFVVLRNRITNKHYELTDDGAIITEKLATLLEVKAGDTIRIKDGDTKFYEVPIAAITENYLFHYVYMTPALYENVFGELPQCNELFLKTDEATVEEEEAFAEELLKSDVVQSVTFVRDLQSTVQDMMKSLDSVIWVLIISAAMLAFVVLYNLNNINITERKRELATLKVLGFYDMEVAEYVYRENIFLTIFGILAGVVMGVALHQFVIRTCEIDMMMFGRAVKPLSYVYSVVLTVVFSLAVNISMFYKLRKIDMIESLKSVE